MAKYAGQLTGTDLEVAIVQSRFNALVVERLVEGAIDVLTRHGVAAAKIDQYLVPGAFELAPCARRVSSLGRYHLIVCLGAVVRGETPHFEYICSAAARGLADVARESDAAVAFGVLTTDTMSQALDRAGGKAGNKGAEAALAALELANLYRSMTGRG